MQDQSSTNQVPEDLQVSTSSPQTVKESSIIPPSPPLAGGGMDIISTQAQYGRHAPAGWLWIIWVVLGLGLVVGTIYFVLTQISFNKGTITFNFEPNGVRVVIDQKLDKPIAVENNLKIKLKTGEHNILVTKDGYLDEEATFTIDQGEKADMQITLGPVPPVELLAEAKALFPGLIRRDELLAFWDDEAKLLKAINLSSNVVTELFSVKIGELRKVDWASEGATALLKLPGIFRLPNMQDNRQVPGQYIPLGESPEQGPTLNNGVATWLLDGERQTPSGIQPVLLSENVRDIVFSPSGEQIAYFYTAADGERSIIRAENIDGRAWVRVAHSLPADNPRLVWLTDDQYLLMLDDGTYPDRLVNMLGGEITEIMPDRIDNSWVASSPTGDKILYLASIGGQTKLALWDIATSAVEKTWDKPVASFAWESDDIVIVGLGDNSLWRWEIESGKEKPIQFTSSFGEIRPERLIYSQLLDKLFIIESNRIFSVKV